MDDRQQDDSSQLCHQHSGKSDCILDRPAFENRAEEVARQEYTNNGHNHVEQQVRAVVVHEYSRHSAYDCSNDQVNNDVHFYRLKVSLIYTKYRLLLLVTTSSQSRDPRQALFCGSAYVLA